MEVEHRWKSFTDGALLRRDRRAGPYRAHVPDTLVDRPLHVDGDVARGAASAERAVRDLAAGEGATGLDGLSRLLLRSEAIAGSRIEGIAPSSRQVAMAGLARSEGFSSGYCDAARLVANNIAVLGTAVDGLVAAPEVTVEDVEALHRALLPEERHRVRRRLDLLP